MYLKKEPFTGDTGVILHELSALQRVEYLEFIAGQPPVPDDASNLTAIVYQTRQAVTANAWLVSRSLWHSDRAVDEKTLMQQTLESWPAESLSAAATQVLAISGLLHEAGPDDEPGDKPLLAEMSPEKP